MCPVAVRCSPPSCERLVRPPCVSDEGVTGESGSLIFYLSEELLIHQADALNKCRVSADCSKRAVLLEA